LISGRSGRSARPSTAALNEVVGKTKAHGRNTALIRAIWARGPLKRGVDSSEGRLDYCCSSGFSVWLLQRVRKLHRLRPLGRHLTVHISLSLRRRSIKLTRRGKGRWANVRTGLRGRPPLRRVRRGIPAPQATRSKERSDRRASWRCDHPRRPHSAGPSRSK